MKRAISIALVVFFLMPGFAFAEHAQGEAGEGKEMMHKKMMDKDGKPDMHKMMMMKKSQMVATKDGGVVILYGKYLLKYDKNLKLIKKTKIDIDWKKCKKGKEKAEAEEAKE